MTRRAYDDTQPQDLARPPVQPDDNGLKQVRGWVGDVQRRVDQLSGEVLGTAEAPGLKVAVAVLQREVDVIRTEQTQMRGDVTAIKTDFESWRSSWYLWSQQQQHQMILLSLMTLVSTVVALATLLKVSGVW